MILDASVTASWCPFDRGRRGRLCRWLRAAAAVRRCREILTRKESVRHEHQRTQPRRPWMAVGMAVKIMPYLLSVAATGDPLPSCVPG
jgi:hypothetical protein